MAKDRGGRRTDPGDRSQHRTPGIQPDEDAQTAGASRARSRAAVPGRPGPENPIHPAAEVPGAETPDADRRHAGDRNSGDHLAAVRRPDADQSRVGDRPLDGAQSWNAGRHPAVGQNCDSVRHPGEIRHSGAEETLNQDPDQGLVDCPSGLAPDADPIPDGAVRRCDRVGVHRRLADDRCFDTGVAVRPNVRRRTGGCTRAGRHRADHSPVHQALRVRPVGADRVGDRRSGGAAERPPFRSASDRRA